MTETNYIWSREKLHSLLNHPLEEIQSWATCRLLELYPNKRDEMLVKAIKLDSLLTFTV